MLGSESGGAIDTRCSVGAVGEVARAPREERKRQVFLAVNLLPRDIFLGLRDGPLIPGLANLIWKRPARNYF